MLVLLALLTSIQIRYWRSSYDLWSHTLDVTKDNFVGEENLGNALLALSRPAEALPHLQKATRIRPLDPNAHLSLGGAFATSGQTRDAIAEYEAAIPRVSDPNTRAAACETLGRLYIDVGNYAKARESYRQALQLNPRLAEAQKTLDTLKGRRE